MEHPAIEIPRERLEALCRQHGVRRLELFGSVLRKDFTSESDVDVLVEFESGRTPGLSFFGLQEELSDALGRSVDLNTRSGLKRLIERDNLIESEVVYDAT